MGSRQAVVCAHRRAQVRQAVEGSQRCFVVLTGVFTIGAAQIKFSNGEDGSLNPDLHIVVNGVGFRNDFGGDTGISFPAASESFCVDASNLWSPALRS